MSEFPGGIEPRSITISAIKPEERAYCVACDAINYPGHPEFPGSEKQQVPTILNVDVAGHEDTGHSSLPGFMLCPSCAERLVVEVNEALFHLAGSVTPEEADQIAADAGDR